jgi:hypothetical protein
MTLVEPELGEKCPEDRATNVNPDTHLALTFQSKPILGRSGQIHIHDASNNGGGELA